MNNNYLFDEEALAFASAVRNTNYKNENKCLRKNHKRWLKILALEQAEQRMASATRALDSVASQLRSLGVYDTVTPELLLSLQNKEKDYLSAKNALEAAKLIYGREYDWIKARAEMQIKNTKEYKALSNSAQARYIEENLPAYMEYVVYMIQNDLLAVENSKEITDIFGTHIENDPTVVEKYVGAYENINSTQAAYDKAAEDYYSQGDSLISVLNDAGDTLDAYRYAKAELDALLEKKTAYTTARDKVRSCERALEDLLISQQDLNRSAALNSLELQDLNDQIERAQQKADELAEGAAGNEITADVGGIIGSISITAGNTTVPKTAMATIEVPDMGYLVSFSVTADQARRVHTGDPASAANVYWGSQIEATLTGIRTDPKDPQNSKIVTFEVKGDVTPGSSLTLTVGQRGAEYDYIVPRSAVRPDSTNGDYVLVITAKNSPLGDRYIATRVPVEVLARDDLNAAVNGALEQGDFVITTSSAPIDNGKRVRLADTQ